MAEENFGKSVKQLKHERTLAKIAFIKHANYISREAKHMVESELREEFKQLVSEARKVFETNEDYRIGLQVESDAGEEEATPSKI